MNDLTVAGSNAYGSPIVLRALVQLAETSIRLLRRKEMKG